MRESGKEQQFENLPVEDLAELLREFYGTVLRKNSKEYSRSGLINLRSGLNRYLRSPPFKRDNRSNARQSVQSGKFSVHRSFKRQ